MKVLVAEDDPLYQALLGNVLRRWGYEPVMVGDGERAWDELRSPRGPQLAVLDWMMPGLHGIEICRRVRGARLPHYVYIVLLTARTEPGDLLAGLEAGADDYLPKPVNLEQLQFRLRAAVRVLKAEKRHRMIAAMASDGILSFDSSGTVQFANRSAAALFGTTEEDLTGAKFNDVAPEFDYGQLERQEPVSSELGGRARSWAPMELRGRDRAGRSMLLEVSFAELVEKTQEAVITAVIRDVTGRKVRESQKAHIQKLESIGQLAAGVAHEINTPIQYIGDNLQFVRTAFQAVVDASQAVNGAEAAEPNPDLPFFIEEAPQAIDQAIEGANRVAEIVRALKEFSHPGTEDAAPVDLNHLLENASLVSRNRWKYVAELRMDFDTAMPAVRCIAGELNQVFLNLIVNAADAIKSAQERQPDRKGELCISSRTDGRFAEVRISDNGTGIPEEVRPKVFDPFFTTKAVGSGTGQGLSIAYNIVARKHGGTIAFETEAGVGTTFVVRLPIEGRVEEVPDAGEVPAATNQGGE